MATYNLDIDTGNRKFIGRDTGNPARISMMFAEYITMNMAFPTNSIDEGDILILSLDNDRVFYSGDSVPNPPDMIKIQHTVTSSESSTGNVSISFTTRTEKFRNMTNGRNEVPCILSLVKWTGSTHNNASLMAESESCLATYLPSEKIS